MKPAYLVYPLPFSCLILFVTLVSKNNPALSQASNIVPDNTLGDESSQVIENVQGLPVEVIEGGAQRGQNLFHSFQEFNVSEGRGAYFNSPNIDIQNIFSRVTGNNPSEIMGVLGTFGLSEPNLYLINPNGIIFGANSSLDVQGSFVATTSSGVRFGEQGSFDAINPQTPQLLTINPSAYLFNQIQAGATIENRSIAPAGLDPFGINAFGLRVPDGESLLLLGGNVKLDGGILSNFGGKVELGGLVETGEININDNGSLLFPENVERSDIIFLNQALVDTSGEAGGEVRIHGRRVSLKDESNIFSLTLGSQSGGNITIDASESVELIGDGFPSRAGLFNAATAEGIAGNIQITTKNLTVQNSARISTIAFEEGQGGDIKINATESVQLLGDEAGRLPGTGILTGGGLNAESRGIGRAGNIEIITGNLILQDKTVISVDSFDVGVGGNLTIQAENILIQTGSAISSATFGLADAGNITVKATEIEIDGINDDDSSSSITTQAGGFILPNIDFTTVQDITGNAGNLTINTERLILRNGARIKSSTFNAGSAGNLKIEASELVELMGSGLSQSGLTSSGLFAGTEVGSSGNAGELIIETKSLSIRDGAQVGTGNRGDGQGGRLEINASDSVEIIGTSADGTASGLFSQTEGLGQGGNLNVISKRLNLQNGGSISSQSQGIGNAGDIAISLGEILNARDSNINASAESSSGGAINIFAGDIRLQGNSNIRTNVESGAGGGGDIILTADSIIAFDDSDIFAFAADGQGGDITLNTPVFFAENFTLNSLTSNPDDLEDNSRADINATGAVSGAVSIPDVSFIQNSLTELPDNAINTDELVANSCVVRSREQNGTFVITGGGGFPIRPGNTGISNYSTGKVRSVPNTERKWQRGEPIIEPQGFYRLTNGKLVLSRECPEDI